MQADKESGNKTVNFVGNIFMMLIGLASIGFGIYQFIYGISGSGINSRGGVTVNYGGTSVFMGLLLLWGCYILNRKNRKNKNKP